MCKRTKLCLLILSYNKVIIYLLNYSFRLENWDANCGNYWDKLLSTLSARQWEKCSELPDKRVMNATFKVAFGDFLYGKWTDKFFVFGLNFQRKSSSLFMEHYYISTEHGRGTNIPDKRGQRFLSDGQNLPLPLRPFNTCSSPGQLTRSTSFSSSRIITF